MTNSSVIVAALVVLFFIPTMFALWHAFTHAFASQTERVKWIVATVFLPPVGGILYMLIGRKRAIGKTGLRLF